MKKNVTYIDYAKFAAVVAEQGLTELPQAGFVKVQGPKGRQVYIAKTKRVGRVDVSGFEMPEGTPSIVNLGGESFGNVRQQLDFSAPEADVLAAFSLVLGHMKELPALDKISRTPRAAKPEAAPAPEAPVDGRKAKIMARAQELISKGAPVAAAVSQAQSEIGQG